VVVGHTDNFNVNTQHHASIVINNTRLSLIASALSCGTDAGRYVSWHKIASQWRESNPTWQHRDRALYHYTTHVIHESLPPKTFLWTSCPWPPWPWFSREKSLKILKVLSEIQNFKRHLKNLFLAGKWV
jgi:hypothetical protein